MAVTAVGGGSSAVAASSHAACARFRGTDPLITGFTRRALATELKFPDVAGSIPEARWMRAMAFERLVRDERFASQVATTTVGRLGLDRPTRGRHRRRQGQRRTAPQASGRRAQERSRDGAATLIHEPAVPFLGFEDDARTDVKPDFVVVAAKTTRRGRRVVADRRRREGLRARPLAHRRRPPAQGLPPGRFRRGGFEAVVAAPGGLDVHRFGVLAVPQNAFLQPQAVVEDLARPPRGGRACGSLSVGRG